MQRVLSFQMARGFGESSEFVTKRMCFSFLFSVGFLCLLCGFLIGRFAAGRAIDIRAEKTRLQLAGNGLASNEHLRENLVQTLGEDSFDDSYVITPPNAQEAQRIKNVLLDLQFFDRVVENHSCIAATVRGYYEPDRYIILSGHEEGIVIVMALSKALKSLNEDFDWKPRRTITFMISLEASEACQTFVPNHVRENVVAYIELNVQIGESGYFAVTGSDIVQSSILRASDAVENPNGKNHVGPSLMIIEEAATCREIICLALIPRLGLDIPNAAITFVSAKNSSSQIESPGIIAIAYRRAIAQIIGTSVWRLSEMTLFKWDPRKDNNDIIKILESLNSTDHRKNMANLVSEIYKMTHNIAIFNDKMERMETTKSLKVRMANDLSMRVRRVILCNDDHLQSRTDWLALRQIFNDSTSNIDNYLGKLLICYQTANQLLQEDVT